MAPRVFFLHHLVRLILFRYVRGGLVAWFFVGYVGGKLRGMKKNQTKVKGEMKKTQTKVGGEAKKR